MVGITSSDVDVPAAGSAAASAPRVAVLQACRAVAAFLVVLTHNSGSIFDRAKYFPSNPTGHVFDFGQRGVEFFFVLSGFIIMSVHWKDLGRPGRAGRFLFKRIWRIYPLYWLLLFPLLAVFFAVPGCGEGFEKQGSVIVSSALLIGGWRFSPTMQPLTILAAAWTLYYEVLFYAVFLVLIINRRVGALIMGAWFALCLANLAAGPFGGPMAFFASPRNLLFPLGMLACVAIRRWHIRYPLLWALCGSMLFFGAGLTQLWPGLLRDVQQSLLCGLGSAVALLGLIELERSHALRVPAWLMLLGDASYALYLVHLSVLVLLAKLFAHVPHHGALPLALVYPGFAFVAVAAGVALHLLVEKPLLRLGALWLRPRAAGAHAIADGRT